MNVSAENGALIATVGPKNIKITLKPWNRDSFLMSIPKMEDDEIKNKFITFQTGPDGRAVSLKMDPLGLDDPSRSAVFERV